ncbi:response regulator [Hyalangium versicolor]|uniref:response regulator n=1 Tax=Hyalangium versicolor TaxID=2861190 RepID=UPI001CCA3E3B|nr:response regulator [Hyalangium versicolor]
MSNQASMTRTDLERALRGLEEMHRKLQASQQELEKRYDSARLELSAHHLAVGTLVSGIAHELNNPLALLMNGLTLALQELRAGFPAPSDVQVHGSVLKNLADVQTGAERIQEIVKDLVAFAPPVRPQASRAELLERALIDRSREITFSIRLPATPPEREAMTPPPLPPEPAPVVRRGRILIVDDEHRFGQTLQLLLGRAHEVSYTPSARQALEWLQAGRSYDAILCDLMMAEVTGQQFYDALHQQSPDLARRVIFMTGGAYTPDSVDFVRKMTNPVLNKPFKTEDLEKLLGSLMPSV